MLISNPCNPSRTIVISTNTADSGITFGGPTSTMPTKAELERKVADLRRQLQTATEKEHEAQGTIYDLQQQITEQQIRLEDALRERDAAMESATQLEVALSDLSREVDGRVLEGVENVRHAMSVAHQREVDTQADLISMLKDKLALYEGIPLAGAGRNDDPYPSRDLPTVHDNSYSVATDVNSEASHVVSTELRPTPAPRIKNLQKPTPAPRRPKGRATPQLPPLPMFGGADTDDGDALQRWVNKLQRHAQLQQWTGHEALLQFELHLAGKAELLYEVLPNDTKVSLDTAVSALRDRLQPVQHAALASAQLMRRKQGTQFFEQLFERSYGSRAGMDNDSKAILKRDLFTQGLLRKWQEKNLTISSNFS